MQRCRSSECQGLTREPQWIPRVPAPWAFARLPAGPKRRDSLRPHDLSPRVRGWVGHAPRRAARRRGAAWGEAVASGAVAGLRTRYAMPPGFRHTVVQQRAAVDSDGEGVLTCAGKEFHNLTAILLDRRVPPTRKM